LKKLSFAMGVDKSMNCARGLCNKVSFELFLTYGY
jgi:hypothetical protein